MLTYVDVCGITRHSLFSRILVVEPILEEPLLSEFGEGCVIDQVNPKFTCILIFVSHILCYLLRSLLLQKYKY